MKEPPPATNCKFSFAAFLAFFCVLVLFSCSEDRVNILSLNSNLILDWQDDESLPEQRLCVFAELSSNARRLESLIVKRDGYVWNIDSPILIQSGDRQWAGSPHLEPPVGLNGAAGSFAPGDYFVECVDAAGEKAQGSFFVAYDKSLLDSFAKDLPQKIPAAKERLAVYSESNELLYFDERKESWFDDEAVFKGVKNSSYYRKTRMTGNLLCFEPKIFKDGEKPDELE